MNRVPAIKKTALLHFLPLELYPPAMNFINCLVKEQNDTSVRVSIYTTHCMVKELAPYKAPSGTITIKRFGASIQGNGLIKRIVHYLRYYLTTIVQLALTRPGTVFYYDTISSFPAWCYKTFFNRSCRIFIHYHEYMSKEEYAGGMQLLRWFHTLEMGLYKKAHWVSHTNQDRMKFFLEDMPQVHVRNTYILPNYPPQSWKLDRNGPPHFPIRFIQVGSLGMNSMYTKEFAEWIIAQNGRATWHIYSVTVEPAVMDYLNSLQSSAICFKGKVNYDELPAILQQYDIGVILYKGHIPNFIYNAPNKMFEYYMRGLDTWFPAQMITAAQYTTSATFPRIVPVAFENLSLYVLDEMINRAGLVYRQNNYTAEMALAELIDRFSTTKDN